MKIWLRIVGLAWLFGALSVAAAPVSIKPAEDQRVQAGQAYKFQPRVQSEDRVLWHKAYGPDELSVDPFTGAVRWQVPEKMPSQSLHVGVVASDGSQQVSDTWIVTVGDGKVHYMSSSKALSKALKRVKSGDTLVLPRGTIDASRATNRIDSERGVTPKSGKPHAFTTIIAPEPGVSVFDVKDDDAFGLHLIGAKYIKLAGFVVTHAGRIGIRLLETNGIWIQDVGVGDSGRARNDYKHKVSNLNVIYSENFLIEGVYVWGHGRYKIQLTRSKRGVVRRSIARIDHYYGSNPIGGFQSYCSKNIVYQNNMLIDADSSDFWPRFKNHQNAFGVPATNCNALPVGNVFTGNIVLNSHIGAMQTDASDADSPTVWNDLVAWDLTLDGYRAGKGPPTSVMRGVGLSTAKNLTIGEIDFRPSERFPRARYLYSRNEPSEVSHSILTGLLPAADLLWAQDPSLTLSDSILHDFGGKVTGGGATKTSGITETDPKLRYLPLSPAALSEACAGERCGATILNYTGRSGSFWGQSGYDEEQSVSAWPVAGEDVIAEHFRSYRHEGKIRGGSTAVLSGDRGFAAHESGLTNYVWGYLGEVVPPHRVHARPTADGGVEVAWLPTGENKVESYKVYGLTANAAERELLATVPAAKNVLSIRVDADNKAEAYAVSAVAADSESPALYPVRP